jgi:hypothetical protein
MENNTFSFDNIAQKIFTPTSTGVKFNKTAEQPSLTSNVMKQAMMISDDTVKIDQADSYKDAIYRIKETEKILSKKILFAIYNFQAKQRMDTMSGLKFKTYKYTNLTEPIPCLKKLNMVLTQVETMMSNYSGVGVVSDKAKSYYEALNEMIHHISDAKASAINDMTGCNVPEERLVIETFAYFRGGKNICTENIMQGERITQIKNHIDSIVDSVATYNAGVNDVIKRLHKLRSELALHYRAMDDQQGRQIDFRKQELSNAICVYVSKYLKYANIIYSMKADALKEYLSLDNSVVSNFKVIKVTESYDISDDDDLTNISEDADLMDLYTFNHDREEIYSDSLIALESEYTDVLVKDLINEADEGDSKTIWERIKALFIKIKDAILNFFGLATKKLQEIKNDKSLIDNMAKHLNETDNAFEIDVPSVNLDAALSRIVNLNMKDFQFFYEKIMNSDQKPDDSSIKLITTVIPEMNNLDGLDTKETLQKYLKNYFAGNDLSKVKEIQGDDIYVTSKLTAATMKTITMPKLFAQVNALADLKVPAQFTNKLQNKLEAAQRYKDQEIGKLKGPATPAGTTQESVDIKKILEEYFNDIDGLDSYKEGGEKPADAGKTPPPPNNKKDVNNGTTTTSPNPKPEDGKTEEPKPENKANPDNEKKIKELETAFGTYSAVVNNIMTCAGDAAKEIYNKYYKEIFVTLMKEKLGKTEEKKPEEGNTDNTQAAAEQKPAENTEQNNRPGVPKQNKSGQNPNQ